MKNTIEQKMTMIEEQLAQELNESKSGKLGGKMLSLLGAVIGIAGVVLGGKIVLVIIGGVLIGLGQMVQGKSRGETSQQVFDTIVPDMMSMIFEDVQINPAPHLLDVKDTNIPLPNHSYCSGSGYVRGIYRGLTTELCTIELTSVSEVQREETGLWEKTEQWMLCELNQEFSTWLTIWPRDRMDKLFNAQTIKTNNEAFDKRFNLSSDDVQAALHILSSSRIAQILTLADSTFGRFSMNLNSDGRLYIAVHSGRGFFDLGKGRENPAQLCQRFTSELKWFTELIDTFCCR